MQTLVRIVVALVIVVLLLFVALPLQLVNMLAENQSKPAGDLESEPASTSPARAAAPSASPAAQPRIRSEAINIR
jgi:predicted secreted protein